MKIFLIVLACWVGLFIYGMIGAVVFALWSKLEGRNWKMVIRGGDDDSFAFGCIVGWPVLLAILVVVSPALIISNVLEKLAKR